MPTDHATILFEDVKVPASAVLGPLDNGLAIAQTFTHENRIRQASSSCGAAKFCVDRSVKYARDRTVFGKQLSSNQAIQWPLVELSTQCEMLRLLILRTANEMDDIQRKYSAPGASMPPWIAIEKQLGHKISMCNYYANRLATQAADNAIQVHGGNGYSRHQPFEHRGSASDTTSAGPAMSQGVTLAGQLSACRQYQIPAREIQQTRHRSVLSRL